ncbi:bifunctional lysylphosphatidylglycerol synthetase/lysine--tRNA ligase LysX [Gordonia sp. SID5947]|uniref:bifunctional lysylphosphatidylglycerol synthetase/lysine--tRNA ligase LysX n=1 Tax=Gordonia sp. SID5947 TaxID=2690315 RepID=UPI00136A7A51|nr:bifunctional lysylphosphatidylglycerol synthetase/lysine--tRNA ligase LysX [Gordonia sp. SID5947]MYR07927.1 bifunctional lysylphosphatidylglycerol synthetase/lysine--tRNA ligase LysX [Gordonia sp. SID5947]
MLGGFAVLLAVWSVVPPLRRLVNVPREYLDEYYFDAPDTSLSWALVVALLAAALSRGKRIAWWVLTLYIVVRLSFTVVLGVAADDADAMIASGVLLAVLGILMTARSQFFARVRPGAVWRSVAVLMIGCLLGTLAGWMLVTLIPGSLEAGDRLWWSFNRVTALSLIDQDDVAGRPPSVISAVLGAFGALALLAAVVTLFQAQRSRNSMTGYDESAIRGLLAKFGGEDSLGYFATRRDKAVVFAPSGMAAVTYRVETGVCVASGDPIGDPREWAQAIAEWRRIAAEFGWALAVMGASQKGGEAYRNAGLSVLHLGDEAIISTRDFSLSGAEMRQVRQAVTRVRRQGLTVRIRRHADIPVDEMADVVRLAGSWRGSATERGFSMALGRLGDRLDGDCILVEAIRPDGQVAGLLSLVPWGRHAVSLDVMRRDPSAPNGVIELMITDLTAASEEFGLTRISLNFAVFRTVFRDGARLGAGPVLRAWRGILQFLSRWWQLETLYRANAKYRPQWTPRFLCYEDAATLPRVGLASAIAEGFVSLPRLWGTDRVGAGVREPLRGRQTTTEGLCADGSTPPRADGDQALPQRRLPEQVRVRLSKLERLTAAGVDAYPTARTPTHDLTSVATADVGTEVRVIGRLVRMRDHGGVVFVDVRDWSGELQVLVDAAVVGRPRVRCCAAEFDIGDLVEFGGTVGLTRGGQMSLLAVEWSMRAKCLHPLPDKWRGLSDPEVLVRQRYLDLMINPAARTLIEARSAIVSVLRDEFRRRGFLEVETPVLQRVHGGANAAPFRTHINAYDLDLFLRIAPELYLKRLCVAGMERVFEIGRVFRNEGADSTHNPEFTVLEAYQAHSDYEEMMTVCREMIQAAAVAIHGRAVITRQGPHGEPADVDISGEWPVVSVYDAVSEAIDHEITPQTELSVLHQHCDRRGVAYRRAWDEGAVVQALYEELVERHTGSPTFYVDFPESTSPLTRPHPSRDGVAARWDLVAWGVELGTAYSELTDPVEQRRRLTEQSLRAAGGDFEAMQLDEEFLHALEYGMPPTGGLGIGVDRVVMLITGAGIRESLAFPLVKPR